MCTTWSEFVNERSVVTCIRDNSFAKQMCSVFISRQRIADGMRSSAVFCLSPIMADVLLTLIIFIT